MAWDHLTPNLKHTIAETIAWGLPRFDCGDPAGSIRSPFLSTSRSIFRGSIRYLGEIKTGNDYDCRFSQYWDYLDQASEAVRSVVAKRSEQIRARSICMPSDPYL